MRPPLPIRTVIAATLLLGAACNTPREGAQADSAAGGSPMSKLDSTENCAPEAKAATTSATDTTADSSAAAPKTP